MSRWLKSQDKRSLLFSSPMAIEYMTSCGGECIMLKNLVTRRTEKRHGKKRVACRNVYVLCFLLLHENKTNVTRMVALGCYVLSSKW